RLIELTGNPALEGFTAPKLVWLRNHERASYDRIKTVMLPKDYIRYRLTGEIATDVSDAAGTLLYDVRRREWSSPVVESLGLDPAWLPRVAESAEVVGAVTQAAAELTGLNAGTPVVARSEEHTSELQSRENLVCRLLLEKKKRVDDTDDPGAAGLD